VRTGSRSKRVGRGDDGINRNMGGALVGGEGDSKRGG